VGPEVGGVRSLEAAMGVSVGAVVAAALAAALAAGAAVGTGVGVAADVEQAATSRPISGRTARPGRRRGDACRLMRLIMASAARRG
jgi:hypothetical protein